jgi:ABC-type transporter Mla subunit MlaD
LDEITLVINRVSGDHERDRVNVSKNIADLKAVVEKIPTNLVESAQKTFEDGIAEMRTTFKASLDKQTKDAESVQQHTRSKTQETLNIISQSLANTTTHINDSLKKIPDTLDRLNESLRCKSETEKAAANAIASLAQETKADLHESIKVIPTAVDRLNELLCLKSDNEKAAAAAITSLAQESKTGIRNSYEDAAQKQKALSNVSANMPNATLESDRKIALDSISVPTDEVPPPSSLVASVADQNDRERGIFRIFFGGRKS